MAKTLTLIKIKAKQPKAKKEIKYKRSLVAQPDWFIEEIMLYFEQGNEESGLTGGRKNDANARG